MTVRGRQLSPAQHTLYSQQRLFPDDPAYNLGFLYRVRGDLDSERLRRAGELMAARAVPLNEYFVERDGTVSAEYDPDNHYAVELDRRTGDAAARLTAEISAELDRPIPMDRWPLYSARMVQDDTSTYVVLIASHLVADALTFYNLITDLGKLYGDLDFIPPGGELLPLPPAADPDRARAAVTYFRSNFVALETLSTPEWEGDRQRDGQLPGEHVTMDLGPDLSAAVHAAVKELKVGKVAFFLAVHLLVLGCLTASARVTTAFPLANRRRDRKLLRAYGYHVNTLPLSIDLDEYETFDELCAGVQERIDALVAFEDISLGAHAREIFDHPAAAVSRPSSSFTFYRQKLSLRIPGCEFTPIPLPRARLICPFVANVEQHDRGYTYYIQSSSRVADSRPQDVLRAVLTHIAGQPRTRLDAVPWLGARELAELREQAGTRVEPPAHQTITHAFEEQARRTPDAVAVSYEGVTLTYAELNRRADRLAAWIDAELPGDFTGIAMQRSPELITTILAVLKSGRAYVPIDPAAPAHRVEAIVSQFDSLHVLTDSTDLPTVAALRCHDVHAAIRAAAANPAPFQPAAGRPAYVIFTSGSTGTPKGVVVTHANVLRLFTATAREIDFGADDVWSLFHSYAFDFAVWEMFGALLHGGRLEIVPEWTRRSPADFAVFLAERGVTVLSQTPSAFRALSAVLTPALADELAVRTVVFGGEALQFETLAPWVERYGHRAELINMYGITETTVHATAHRVTPGDLKSQRPSVIGRALDDLRITLVDTALRPVPDGVAGEILIAGPGVSNGYLNQPGLTAERFLRPPFADEIHYRSGDLARRETDGTLIYLGRMDQQIQLRGVRIELGEVEAALSAHDGVGACAVRLDGRDADAPELVAFIVATTRGSGDDGTSVTVTDAELRLHLRDRLPAAMRPTRFVRTEQLPLTVNGKLDDACLPWPEPLEPDNNATEITAAAASTPAETVRNAWSKVLGRTDFSDAESFFDAGGTSIQLVQLLEELRAGCPHPDHLEMVDLFEFTTVQAQAAHLATLL
ncbi:amino acid adenylation domain-containing protein [Nocardia sp. NPDC058058]|uniref:non-ribosomal peptide synthetase n=1 Tax=Nocardia sp. NPDC058058 TaxID=3346317 RepID=UPI0036D826E6